MKQVKPGTWKVGRWWINADSLSRAVYIWFGLELREFEAWMWGRKPIVLTKDDFK